MTLTYLYQDRLVPKEKLQISPEDRGYYFGDGVYEVFRVYNGRLYEAAAHFERWERSAADLRIPLPAPSEELTRRLEELIRINSLSEGTVYMQVTRGAAPRSHPFPADTNPILMAYTTEARRPLNTMKEGITTVTMEDIRWLRCDLKTLNLLPNVMAKQHAIDQGAGDVILHRNNTVTECSASNIMIVKDGVITTHPANHLILHGITRAVVLRLSHGLGLSVKEIPFTLDELRAANEVFITGTTVEVTPVISIDGAPVADGKPGPNTRKLQHEFEKTLSI